MQKIIKSKFPWADLAVKARAALHKRLTTRNLLWTPLGHLPEKFVTPLVTKGLLVQEERNPIFYSWRNKQSWWEWQGLRRSVLKMLEDSGTVEAKYYDEQESAIAFSTRSPIVDRHENKKPLHMLVQGCMKLDMSEENKELAREYKFYEDKNDKIIGRL